MFCSIDKIDLAAKVDGAPVAIQSDLRSQAEIHSQPELSVLCALARVVNARAQLADDGHPNAAVHYVVAGPPPEFLRDALAAAGATLERGDKKLKLEPLGPVSPYEIGLLADRAFAALAKRTAARTGVRDIAIALRMLEDETRAVGVEREDEFMYWSRVLELAALAGELLRAKYPGAWILNERALVPFGFRIEGEREAIMFPTNRAQRVVEEGGNESLFKLLLAAEETGDSQGRLMPSLRDRRDVDLAEIVWRPVLGDDAPQDLPIIVCGIDGESTFGVMRKDALGRDPTHALAEAYSNLAAEHVQVAEVGPGIICVSGSFYAAEKLLDREFMRGLHDELAADVLAASTPARGCLLVGRITDEPAAIARFATLTRERHDEAGQRAISPAVMLVSDGRVAGYVRGPQDQDPDDVTTPQEKVEPPKKLGFFARLFGRK
ncbi:MAG TPA: hypothetical protein VGC41_26685 [Kofleriaceae bacterium]